MSVFQKAYDALPTTEKHLLDIASITTVVGALTDFLPHVATAFTVVWMGIRIWESDTVQYLFGREPKPKNPKE